MMSIMMVMPTKKQNVDEDDVGDIGYNGIIKSMDMDDDDIYIMVKCLFVCHEKSTLPPGSLL